MAAGTPQGPSASVSLKGPIPISIAEKLIGQGGPVQVSGPDLSALSGRGAPAGPMMAGPGPMMGGAPAGGPPPALQALLARLTGRA
jgi:hypothetical protein